jgi:hypothetical protein
MLPSDNETQVIVIDMNDTLAALRSLIETVAGIDSNDQRLFHEGMELEGNRQSLRDLHLDDNDIITVKKLRFLGTLPTP